MTSMVSFLLSVKFLPLSVHIIETQTEMRCGSHTPAHSPPTTPLCRQREQKATGLNDGADVKKLILQK